MTCHKASEFTRTVEKIILDPAARREWLWLRARERADDRAAADLERIDPQLGRRMAEYDAAVADLEPEDRQRAFGLMLDARMPCVEVVWCDCARCFISARSPPDMRSS